MRVTFCVGLGLVATLLGGCAGRVIETTVPFNATQAQYVTQSGKNVIEGQAFLRQRGGGIVTCAGYEVDLRPAVEFTQQRVEGIYGSREGGMINAFGGASQENLPAAYTSMRRIAVCDAEGDFSFEGLADGDYYVATRVMWTVGNSIIPEGGAITKRVRVSGGETKRIILN